MTYITQALKTRQPAGIFLSWHEIVFKRLLGDYASITTGAKTAAAESGLGLRSCAYWYISRIETFYGRVLMVWRSIRAIDDNMYVFSPCDTGGIWHGHITTPHFWSDLEKRDFVNDYSFPASFAVGLFEDWLCEMYPNSSREYVAGSLPPDNLIHDEFDPFMNDSPAWSWEMRASKSINLSDDFTIDSIYWSESDFLSFRAYLQSVIPRPYQIPLSMLLNSCSKRYDTPLIAIQAARTYVADQTDTQCYK